MNTSELDSFTLGYLECALWSSVDDNDDPLDYHYDIEDIDADSLGQCVADCKAFQDANYRDYRDLDADQAGHDFWLTRNGHGAGFWDRGLGELGDRLTDASKAYGEVYIYVGDEGKLHVGKA